MDALINLESLNLAPSRSNHAAPLRVVCRRSIHEVDEALWDSLNARQDLFHTHRFIRAVEDAGIENSRFWYLFFYHGDELIATAALSAFVVSLDLFTGGILKKLISGVRRCFPGFLKINVLFCGLPISIGKHALAIADFSRRDDVLDLLAQEMFAIGRAEKIRFMCVKEFLASETPLAERLVQYEFFRAHSIPYVSMEMRWQDFRSYMAAMRHSYRRQMLGSLKKLGQSEPIIQIDSAGEANAEKPVLVLAGPEICSPRQFHALYREVMRRAKTKLEMLNQAFFQNFYENMRHDFELLVVMQGKEILGAALLAIQDQTMTFLLTGIDYSKRDEHDAYFILLYGIVLRAMQRGCRRLDLGQTSYWLKQRIGGVCLPQFFYLRAAPKAIHFILKALRPVVFPELKTLTPRVFREV